MHFFIIAFLISTTLSALLVRSRIQGVGWGTDFETKPQKAHDGSSSRIGGVAIFIAMVACWVVFWLKNSNYSSMILLILASSVPVFFAGLWEDIAKNIDFRIRFALSLLSAALLIFLLGVPAIQIDIAPLDALLLYFPVNFLFLCIAISGLCHAYNLIDGLNGLASMVGILSLLAILYVGIKTNDSMMIYLCGIGIGAIFGFFLWNYPRGLIFLGDSGAYLIGFWIAALSVLVVVRNPSVSPWFALAVNTYPVFETLFSIWRRSVHQNRQVMMPDRAHFHSLIYRRIMRWTNPNSKGEHHYLSNAKTSPYLWLLSSMGLIPAVLFWNSTQVLMITCALFAVLYVYLYRRMMRFKTPSWMVNRTLPK